MSGRERERYGIEEGSQSGHGCCFSFTIVDLTKPRMIGGEHYKGQHRALAECFEEAEARLIVDALNAAPEKHPSDDR